MTKIKLLLASIVLTVGLMACSPPWVTVVVDNRTIQDFIIVIDDHYRGHLMAGAVDSITVGRSTRRCQLRWIDKNGVNTIDFSIDRTMERVYIQGRESQYSIESIGREGRRT